MKKKHGWSQTAILEVNHCMRLIYSYFSVIRRSCSSMILNHYFKSVIDSLFQSSKIDDWKMYSINMAVWLENALCTGWIMRSGAGGKLRAVSVEGSGASLWSPKSPLSAYNTNPVRNFYLWRSSETAPAFQLKKYLWLEKTVAGAGVSIEGPSPQGALSCWGKCIDDSAGLEWPMISPQHSKRWWLEPKRVGES